MILTVTPNPALDISYSVDRVVPGEPHHVRRVAARAGGKGINVAAVATLMGYPALAMGLLAGRTGDEVLASLESLGIPHRFLPGPGETRLAINVHDASRDASTVFNELGVLTSAEVWAGLVATVAAAAEGAGAAVGVVSGSLPPGLPEAALRDLISDAPTALGWVVDARGPALLAALAAEPAVVKPNVAELQQTLGASTTADGARQLQARGARLVIVSDGARGLVAIPVSGPMVAARLPRPLSGNPTGAGDALAAGLATGLADGLSVPDLLRRGVAWSGAAVLQPQAGVVAPADVHRLEPTVIIEDPS